MSRVRPFVENDIPQVAELHRQVFRTGERLSPLLEDSYRSYFSNIFLNHPWQEKAIPSLVCHNGDGRILGFLGVLPRGMCIGSQPILAAVSSQFIVEPGGHGAIAAVQLLKAFMAGPQDLSIADDAGSASRRLCEGLGGSTALLYSIYCGRILRPLQFLISRLEKRQLHPHVVAASYPLCRLFDGMAARVSSSVFRQVAPRVVGEELDEETLCQCLCESSKNRTLRPVYDVTSLKWLLDVLSKKNGFGSFRKVVVRNESMQTLGWYLCYLRRGEIGEVLQVGAKEGAIGEVLDHLFYNAWRQGAIAVSWRLEPGLMQQLGEKGCFFHHRGNWMVVHSKKPGLLEAIHRGDAFLTGLEGEWCMRF